MKNILFLTIIFLLSCNSSKKIERENEPTIYVVEDNDSTMNNAILKARSSFDQFKKAFDSKNPNLTMFAIKKAYTTKNNGKEHIWLDSIEIKDNRYFGVVNNLPNEILSLKIGQKEEINKD